MRYIYDTIIIKDSIEYHYVGKHKTDSNDPITDGYFGSGTLGLSNLPYRGYNQLLYAFKLKYGDYDAVRKIILDYADSEEDANLKEIDYVQQCRESYGPLCLNIADGGSREFTDEDRLKQWTPEKRSIKSVETRERNLLLSSQGLHPFQNPTPSMIDARRDSMSRYNSDPSVKDSHSSNMKRINASRSGTKVMYNDIETIYVKPESVEYYLNLGYALGMRKRKKEVSY